MPGSPEARTQVVERNALGPKLSCSFQETPAAAFGPAPAVAGGCASLPRDVPRDTVAGSSGGPHAISSGSHAPLGDTPHRSPASAGDTPGAAAAGTPPGYRSLVGDDKARA